MPPLTPLRLALRSTAFRPTTTSSARALSTTTPLRAADHGHESHYDQPTGWLFGVKPGEKYQKEGWEGIWYWGFYGSFALATVAYAFKPDTRYVEITLREERGWGEKRGQGEGKEEGIGT